MPVADATTNPRTPASGERPSAYQIVGAVALAALGFAVAAGLLHAAVRDPLGLHADIRSEKLAMMQRWRGQAFSAAFGTSHIHYGFDPQVFDAELAGTPAATHSVNLAVEGGSQAEQFAMSKRFIEGLEPPVEAGAPSQACIVVLELSAGANTVLDFLVHPRAINLYDWPTAQLMFHFSNRDMDYKQRVGRFSYPLAGLGLHYANVGMLSNQIFKPPLNEEMLEEQSKAGGQRRMPRYDKLQGQLIKMLKEAPPHPPVEVKPLPPGATEMVERLARMRPATGAQPRVSFVYVVMPMFYDLDAIPSYPDHLTVQGPQGAMEVPIINLGRPDLYPQFYSPPLWYDWVHLTTDGAAMVSRVFGEQLKQWYQTHGGPPPCG